MNKRNSFILFVVLLAFSFIPFIWFRNHYGYLINGVDTNFPLDPLSWLLRRLSVWNPQPNGGSDFSSSSSGFIFHLIQSIPYLMGLPLQTVEIFSFVFWQLCIVFGSYYFSTIIFKRETSWRLIFVCLYSFNIYLFNTWENVKVSNLSLVAAIPFGYALYMGLVSKRRSWFSSFPLIVFTGLLLSGAGINPAYFLTFFGGLLVLASSLYISGYSALNFKYHLKIFITFSFLLISINLFWILPTLFFIVTSVSSNSSLGSIGFTNWLNSLSENTSLFNVFRMQGAWDWYAKDSATGAYLYIPYANNYFSRIPFLIYSFGIVSLLFIPYILNSFRKKSLLVFFGLLLCLGVFLGSGSHEPTGAIFNFFVSHLPFFSLFRSPWYIFTPYVVLSVAGLVSISLYSLCNLLFSRLKYYSLLKSVLVVVFIFCNCLYSYPLITGKIFRPESGNSFYVKFPQYVFDTSNITSQLRGRVIGYPDDDLEKFSWGYIGTESILHLVGDTNTLFKPLGGTTAEFASLIALFYEQLQKSQFSTVQRIAHILNAEAILYKKDQSTISPKISLPDKDIMYSAGQWDLYRLNDSNPLVFGSSSLIYSNSTFAHALLHPQEVLVSENDRLLSYVRYADFTKRLAIQPRKTDYQTTSVTYSLDLSKDSQYSFVIERYKLEDFIPSYSSLKVIIDGKITYLSLLEATDSFITYKPIGLSKGMHTLTLPIQSPSISFITPESYLNLSSSPGIYRYGIGEIDIFSSYVFSFDYRQDYGTSFSYSITQENNGVRYKHDGITLRDSFEWSHVDYVFPPVRAYSSAFFEVEIPPHVPNIIHNYYLRNVRVYKRFSNQVLLVEESPVLRREAFTNVTIQSSKPYLYTGSFIASGEGMLIFNQQYSPQWKITVRDINGRLYSPLFHSKANSYANLWYLRLPAGQYTYVIEYFPQKLYFAGLGISIFVILSGTILVWFTRYIKR